MFYYMYSDKVTTVRIIICTTSRRIIVISLHSALL